MEFFPAKSNGGILRIFRQRPFGHPSQIAKNLFLKADEASGQDLLVVDRCGLQPVGRDVVDVFQEYDIAVVHAIQVDEQ